MDTRALFAILLTLSACAAEAPLEGRHCPCATGWKCCANNLCAPANESCGVLPDQEGRPRMTGITQNPCGEDEDDFEDGTIDVRWSYLEDGWGNVREFRGDRGLDGTIDSDWQLTYDPEGNLLLEEDHEAGALAFRDAATYDTMARELTHEWDYDGDGNLDERDTWDYGGAQAIKRIDTFNTDGTVTHGVCTYTLLDDGRTDHYDCDWDGDGQIDSHYTYAYTMEGDNSVTTRERSNPSGQVASRMRKVHDGRGAFLSVELWHIDPASGAMTLYISVTHTYGPDGNLASSEQYGFSGDGTRYDRSTYRYSCP